MTVRSISGRPRLGVGESADRGSDTIIMGDFLQTMHSPRRRTDIKFQCSLAGSYIEHGSAYYRPGQFELLC